MPNKISEKDIKRLDELSVLFVSGVHYPATGKGFILTKDLNSNPQEMWDKFLAGARQSVPGAVEKWETMLAAKEYEQLAKDVSSVNPQVGTILDLILKELPRESAGESKKKGGENNMEKTVEELDQEIEELQKAKKKMMMKPGEDPEDAVDQGADESTEDAAGKKKKAKKSVPITQTLAQALARGMGGEFITGRQAQLLKAVAAALDSTWPTPKPGDDAPAGAPFGLLEGMATFEGESPNDGTPWADPFQKAMNQQPDITLGANAVSEADDDAEVVYGTPATRVPSGTQVSLGTPVTKSEFDATMAQVLDALKAVKGHIDAQEKRIGRVEMAKGMSKVNVPEDDEEEPKTRTNKSAGVWAGSAFDPNRLMAAGR